MEIEDFKTKKNPLTQRTEVTCQLHFGGATPSTNEILSGIAKKLGGSTENMVLIKAHQVFGKRRAIVLAYAYDSKEAQSRAHKIHKKQKEKAEKIAKKAAEKAEEKKE